MTVSTKAGRNGKMHISLDGEYSMTVDSAYWYSLGIADGTEIEPESLDELQKEIGKRRAYNKALDLLSRRDHSEKELTRKLNERGFSDCTDDVFEDLREKGFLDDYRYACALANELDEKKLMGRHRILQELSHRGIARETAEQAVSSLESSEEEKLLRLLAGKLSKLPDDESGKRRRYNALIRLGYSHSEIIAALRLSNET